MLFHSPTRGPLTLDGVYREIQGFIAQGPEDAYTLVIGTDSQSHERELVFVSAVVIYRRGKGARYFYQKRHHRHLSSLRQKIYMEASLSMALASQLTERFSRSAAPSLNVEIHLDIGSVGETRAWIREIVGMVTGSGFDAKIKPDSFGASTVADRYTK